MRSTTLLPAAFVGLIAAASPGAAHAASWDFIEIAVPGSVEGTTTVSGINNLGEVVGTYQTAGYVLHGFIDWNGKYTTFDVPGSGGTSLAGINDLGQIVGTYDDNGTQQGFVYSSGAFTNLDYPNSFSTNPSFSPIGINDRWQVLGFSIIPGYYTFDVYRNGAFTTIYSYTPCFDECVTTRFNGLNDSGQFVGNSYIPYNGGIGFVYENDAFTDFTYPGGSPPDPRFASTNADGINDRGQVVGSYTIESGPSAGTYGYVYTDGKFLTIDDPVAPAPQLVGVNDLDQIIGYYYGPDRHDHAFLATETAVPEPTTWAMLGLGFAGLGGAGLRVRRGAIPAPRSQAARRGLFKAGLLRGAGRYHRQTAPPSRSPV